jgi:hypothetical protein
MRDEGHVFEPVAGTCIEKCRICGEINCMKALVLISTLYIAGGMREHRFPLSSQEEVKKIGRELNDAGGMPLMRKVHKLFEQNDARAAFHLERLWNGIGTWKFTEPDLKMYR